jgi:hypothetical protein
MRLRGYQFGELIGIEAGMDQMSAKFRALGGEVYVDTDVATKDKGPN